MSDEDSKTVKLAFESKGIHLDLLQLVPLKTMRPGTKESRKYAQILRSVKAIGLVEAPVVSRDPTDPDKFFLLDGHLRIEALRDLGIDQIEAWSQRTMRPTRTTSVSTAWCRCRSIEWS